MGQALGNFRKRKSSMKTDSSGHTTTSGYKGKKPTKHMWTSKAAHDAAMDDYKTKSEAFYGEVAKRNKKRQLELNRQAAVDKEMAEIKKGIAARKKKKRKKAPGPTKTIIVKHNG